MLINLPNDGKGLEYHIIDLLGHTVHAYLHFDAARRSMEGNQRLAICDRAGNWITERPMPIKE